MECPRRGLIVLEDVAHRHVVKTTCKTWGCPVCRVKVEALVAMRMLYGMELAGRCYFITVTYRMSPESAVVDAASAGRDLARLWNYVKKTPGMENLAWFKVPEMTRAGQVHFHLLAGNIGKPMASCKRKNERYVSWRKNGCVRAMDPCLQHRWTREWERITGDSFVVDVSIVRSAARSAEYVTKYLRKGWRARKLLEAFGYKRRWSSSRNWPSGVKLSLRGTVEGRWKRINVLMGAQGPVPEEEHPECRNIERIGTDLGVELDRKRQAKRIGNILRRVYES